MTVLPSTLARGRRQRSKSGGRPSLLADDAPQFARRDVQLDERRVAMSRLGDMHLIRMVGEGAREHLDHLLHAAAVGHDRYSAATGAAGAGASGVR